MSEQEWVSLPYLELSNEQLRAMMAEYDKTGTSTCPLCEVKTQPWGGLWMCECGAIANAATLNGGPNARS